MSVGVPDSETVPFDRVPDVERLRIALHERMQHEDCIFLDYMPGNGTRYEIVLQRLEAADRMDPARELPYTGEWLVSLIQQRRCLTISPAMTVSAERIVEKTGIGRADAAAIAFVLAKPQF